MRHWWATAAHPASIALGKKQTAEAEQILGNCFVTQLLVSAVLTAVVLIWNRPLLLAFGASTNTIDYSVAYMNIYALGTVFVQLTLGMNAFITAQGFAKVGMLSVLIGAVANTALDPLFIFGFHMGVRGAALATVLSQGLSCLWVLSFYLAKDFYPYSAVQSASARQGHSPLSGAGQCPVRHAGQRERDLRML